MSLGVGAGVERGVVLHPAPSFPALHPQQHIQSHFECATKALGDKEQSADVLGPGGTLIKGKINQGESDTIKMPNIRVIGASEGMERSWIERCVQ